MHWFNVLVVKPTFLSLAVLSLGLTQVHYDLRADDVFTFAGFTFDQRNTPDRGVRLGNSTNIGGATFSSGNASATTLAPINFPQGGPGFHTNLSIAKLCGIRDGLYAVNLPNGNNGTSTRHGLEFWWSNNRAIQNLPGADFVVYESASSMGAVEGVMARVRMNPMQDTWSDWFYFASTNFQVTAGAEGVHAFAFDASQMGVAPNALIDRIQLANLTQADRIAGAGTDVSGTLVGEGKVLFDGSSIVFPDAGIYDTNRLFDATQLDPDPLYIAALQTACEWMTPQLTIARSGNNVVVTWPTPSCFTLQMTTSLDVIDPQWQNVTAPLQLTNNLNTVSVTGSAVSQFFRLIKP